MFNLTADKPGKIHRHRSEFSKEEYALLLREWQNGLTSTKSEEQAEKVEQLARQLGKSKHVITVSKN